jgi:hypothetical protein
MTTIYRAAGLALATALAATSAATATRADEITINITRVKALDRIDVGGTAADFLARVTIAGEQFKTPPIKQRSDIKPDWKISKKVAAGEHAVKIEILDDDALNPADAIDVNRVDNKRDLEFTIDTRSCKVSGFSEDYRCGRTIKRAGQEKKRAALEFRVSVKKEKAAPVAAKSEAPKAEPAKAAPAPAKQN